MSKSASQQVGTNWLRSKIKLWIVIAVILVGGVALAPVDSEGRWLQGWAAYSLMLALGAGALYGVWRLTGQERSPAAPAVTAFLLCLTVGAALRLALPVVGNPASEEHQKGYWFYDARVRDDQSWDLARSGRSLGLAFTGGFSGDQDRYPGMFALSAGIYRLVSPDAHRKLLIVILNAAAAGCSVFFLWKAAREWFAAAVAGAAAWIFALYPESVFLASSQMREPLVVLSLCMAFYAVTQMRQKPVRWLPWLGVAGVLMLLIHAPTALVAFVALFVVWLLEPGRRLSLKYLALFAGALAVAAIAVLSLWASLPALQGKDASGLILAWLQNNFWWQSKDLIEVSVPLQGIIEKIGARWAWAPVLIYGVAQPVLPAILVSDTDALWIMRLGGTFRAVGWYALAPFLIYGFTQVFRAPAGERRAQLIWLGVFSWVWIAVAALNGGGDQWDNPRYRAIFLLWQALLAAWAWQWARTRRDPWLARWLWIEAIFVLSFTWWYITRVTLTFAHPDIFIVIGFDLAAAAGILGVGWWRGMGNVKRKT